MASEDQAPALEAAKKLPYADRVTNKLWYVRAAAFDDIGAACKRALSPEENIFAESGPLFSKGIGDANAAVAEKALEALLLYLENTDESQAARIAGPVCSAIGSKVLKGRPGTLKKAGDACLAFVEWEQAEVVLEPLFKAFKDKVPKVVVAALDIITQAFSQFGPKVVKPQPIVKALPSLFDARQEQVRDGVKKLTVELSGWLGTDYVQGSLCGKMPDLMRKDVEKLMEDGPPPKKLPDRFTRKEQATRAAAMEAAEVSGSNVASEGANGRAVAHAEEEQNVENDSYEYAEPVNITADLNKEFWDGLAASKWSDRRNALQRLKALASQPRLAPGDYGEVLRELRKIIVKDSNVVCVGEAILCVGAFAKSLRTSFVSSAKSFVPVVLEKYKDPKTSIGTAVTECLGNVHKYCLPLPDLADEFVSALNHKNPKIKVDSAKLLQACVDASNKKDAAKVHSTLLPVVAKSANDPALDVREANMGVLVAFAAKAGNPSLLDKVSDGFDETRKKRLQELAQQRLGTGGAQPAAKPAVVPSKPTAKPSASQAVSRTTSSRSGTAASAKPGLSKPPSKKGGASATSQSTAAGPADDDDAALAGGTLSERDAKEKLQEFVGDAVFTGFQDPQWKARLTSMEETLEKIKGMSEIGAETASMLIQGLGHIPGWSEKNFQDKQAVPAALQVLGKVFELLTYLVNNVTVGKKDAFTAIGGLVEKMPDMKLKGPASEALFAISETLGPQFVFIQLHKKAATHKNPKVLSESLLWMAKAVDDFGLSVMNVQQLIEWIKADLGSTNAAVRNAAIQLAATCHKQLGVGLASMIRNDVKPALMSALEDAFRNNPQQQVVPTRKVRAVKVAKQQAGPASAGVTDETDAESPALDADSLLPRTDISSQLGPKLIAGLGSANWRERNHTLEEIESIIQGASRIQPSIGDLVPALKARLTDINKNLVARALLIFGELAKAMGSAWERVGKPVLQQVASFLGDNKKQVRDAAVAALDGWVKAVPVEKVVPAAVEFLAGPKASSEGKVTSLRWIASVVEGRKASRCVDAVLRAVAIGAADKAAEVREAANGLAVSVAQHAAAAIPAALESLPVAIRRPAADLLGRLPVSVTAAAPKVASEDSIASARPATAVTEALPTGKRTKPSPVRIPAARQPESRENSVPNTPSIDGPCLSFSSKKEERLRKGRFKSIKFEAPREYEVDELEEELAPVAAESFRRMLFAKDFKRHIEAADVLLTQMSGMEREVMSCMDLLLRWIVLRICDANTQCLLRVLDLTKALFTMMADQEYQLQDAEAHTILPCLIEKSGHNQDRVRQYNKELVKLGGTLISPGRLLENLMQGLSSKNNRTRVDCVELIGEAVEEGALTAALKSKFKPFAAVAQLVSERDKSLRAAVLSTLEILYNREGEAVVWASVGNLSSQQRSLIEERFKFAAKQAQKSASHARLDSDGNAADHADVIPAHPPPRLAAAWSKSRGANSMDSVQGVTYPASALSSTPSLEEAVSIPGGGRIREPGTPKARSIPQFPGNAIPTPMPRESPAVEPSPPPTHIANLEPEDDEEIHEIYTAAVLKLADNNLEECVEGTKSICYVLQMAAEDRTSAAFLTFLTQCTVEVIQTLTKQTAQVFDAVLDQAEATHQPADSRPCKYLVNALLMAFEVKCMVKAIPKREMRELMFMLLLKLLDRRVHSLLSHNPQIMRGLNVAMFKILGNNFGNPTFESLIDLLLVSPSELQRRQVEPQEFEKLLTKCLVKMTKALPERIQELHLNSLMLSIHNYFTTLGVDEIRRRGAQDEKSLRMVKTLVHELCRQKGDDIRGHMQGIPREGDPIPIIHVYVDLHLETLHGAGIIQPSAPNSARDRLPSESQTLQSELVNKEHRKQNRALMQDMGPSKAGGLSARSPPSLQAPNAGFSSGAPALQRSSKDLKAGQTPQLCAKEIVLPILQRIGVSETSEQGLEELYTFMKQHPEVDTTPFITRLSREFHAFVERGLQRLERRERGAGSGRLSAASSQTSLDLPANGNGQSSEPNISSIGSRMRSLRLSGGSSQEVQLPTIQDVAEMQERMRNLKRTSDSKSRRSE